MEPEARFTFIGAMLLALLIAAGAATVWLTRSGPRTDLRYYTIYFERQSLQGLQVGGDVEMRGVQVGRVERFSISRENINRVQVTIRIDGRTPVSTNTMAVVGRKILTGLARIDLVTPGQPGPELTAVAAGEKYPVVAEGTSDLEQIAGTVNGLAAKGANVLEAVDDLLKPENRAAVTATLASIRSMTDQIRKTAQSAERVVHSAERVAGSADAAAKEAGATLRDLSRAAAALERTADVGLHELRATTQELRSSAEIVARTADRLENPRALIFGPDPAALGPGEKLR
jgi:phospholipid/cholesterol/gamma-HCH transport system substrate-binding protein